MCVAPASRAVYALAMAEKGDQSDEHLNISTNKLTHSSVIVQMDLDITTDDSPQCPDKVIDLTWVRAADSIGDTDSVDADFVYSLVDRKEINKV